MDLWGLLGGVAPASPLSAGNVAALRGLLDVAMNAAADASLSSGALVAALGSNAPAGDA